MALRLLRSRRSAHLSLVTFLSIAGIALGTGALIVVVAVNTGFQVAFQERILATYPHLVVMQRGIDLRDWREVAQRLRALPGVRSAGPATYDDMMLSSARGGAGAVVRGVGAETLRGLPPGAIVAGRIDTRGEAPELRREGGRWRIAAGVSGARHVAVVFGDASRAVPLLATGSGLGGLVVFDAARCGDGGTAAAQGSGGPLPVWLLSPDSAEPLRTGARTDCGEVGSWEALPGNYTVRWVDGGVQRDAPVRLHSGRAAALILSGPHAALVPPPPADLPAAVAAVAVVDRTGAPVEVAGRDDGSLWRAVDAQLPAIAIGEGLAKRLQVQVGDEVRAVSPLRGLDRLAEGGDASASGRFAVTAVVRTGFHDHDQRLALVDFVAAQRFLGRGDIARWVEARVADPILASRQVDRVAAALQPSDLAELISGAKTLRDRFAAGPPPDRTAMAVVDDWVAALRTLRQTRPRTGSAYRVLDWEEMNKNIFDAARMQKVAMSLFPFIIVLVAALNVVGTQAVIVHERAREIAIVRAMGAARRSVAAIFLIQGLFVGVVGTALGLGAGGLACWLLDAVGYPLDPQVYLISRLPVQAEPVTFLLAGGAAIALAFGAAWLAAQRAAARHPVDALRRLD